MAEVTLLCFRQLTRAAPSISLSQALMSVCCVMSLGSRSWIRCWENRIVRRYSEEAKQGTNQIRGIRRPGCISETSLVLIRATRRGYVGDRIIQFVKASLQNAVLVRTGTEKRGHTGSTSAFRQLAQVRSVDVVPRMRESVNQRKGPRRRITQPRA